MGRKSKTQFTAKERAKEIRTKAEGGRDIMLTLPEKLLAYIQGLDEEE